MTIEKISADLPAAREWPARKTTESTPALARAFDAYFLQSMQKSNRMEQHFIQNSNPMASCACESIPCLPDSHQQTSPARLPPRPTIADTPEMPAVAGHIHGARDFITNLWPHAVQAARLIGLDPRLLLAQAALETGWGRHVAEDCDGVSSNNLFNIKATRSDSPEAIVIKTTEYMDGNAVKQSASFKTYPSVAESFQDYLALIQGSARYRDALEQTQDPEAYIHALQASGYATDPHYADKILSVYHGLVQQELDGT